MLALQLQRALLMSLRGLWNLKTRDKGRGETSPSPKKMCGLPSFSLRLGGNWVQ